MFETFNINQEIKVRLTERGRTIMRLDWEEIYSGVKTHYSYSEPPVDEDGYTTFQLWDAMKIFGQHFHMGLNGDQLPFETKIKVNI